MTNFTYTMDIPAASHNPSDDQPPMKINNNNNALIWNQDHIGMEAANGGTHLQQTYTGFSSGTLLGGTASSTAFPAAGTANSENAQYKFTTPASTFIMSAFRAMAAISGRTSNGVCTILNQDGNVVSVTRSGGNYNVILKSGVTTGTSYGVIVTNTIAGSIAPIAVYSITGDTTFTLNFDFTNGFNDPSQFSFLVFQI